MKKIISVSLAILLGTASVLADCQIELNIIAPTGDVPGATASALATRLANAANLNGAAGANNGSSFYLTGRFDHLNKGELAGPPRQYTLTTELTLFIGNSETGTILASHTMNLKGVGVSDQKAFLNAMRGINSDNAAIQRFISEGREKIVEYYDKYAPQLEAKADKAAALGNYAEALFLLNQVPECSRAYDRTLPLVRKYYGLYADREGSQILKKARMLWASDPTPSGASEASALLAEIPVGSSAEREADKLYNEMASSLKDDYKFETRQKYADDIDIEKRRIEAARHVGAAWGNGQKSSTTIIPVK